MILLKDVSYEWEDGRTALKNINLEIKKGEFVLISGKSGSGKSTLGSVMNGLIPHYYKGKMQGKAFVSGKDISKLLLHEIGHIVGTVFQDPRSQFFTTTTNEEIAFGIQTICKSRDEIKQRVETVVLLCKLDVDKHIDVEIKLDEEDVTKAESKGTYENIKEYILGKYGFKVSTLYIAQIKRKCRLEIGENYNKSKKDNQVVPECPKGKEDAIKAALKYFAMI